VANNLLSGLPIGSTNLFPYNSGAGFANAFAGNCFGSSLGLALPSNSICPNPAITQILVQLIQSPSFYVAFYERNKWLGWPFDGADPAETGHYCFWAGVACTGFQMTGLSMVAYSLFLNPGVTFPICEIPGLQYVPGAAAACSCWGVCAA
jgi:hypothetical protein